MKSTRCLLMFACLLLLMSAPMRARAQAPDFPSLNACRASLDEGLTLVENYDPADLTFQAIFIAPAWTLAPRMGFQVLLGGVPLLIAEWIDNSYLGEGVHCVVLRRVGGEDFEVVDLELSAAEIGQWTATVRRTAAYLEMVIRD